jgi:DNA-directed RNA polymerase subunit N (RpoN/RPB10)
MNNEVRDFRGNLIGFRCFTCNDVVPSMWGTTCNQCAAKKNEASALRKEIAELKKAVESLKNN